MIKKILSLVIFGVLTFGMLFGATAQTSDTFNIQVTIPTIDPQYKIEVINYAEGTGVKSYSSDTNNKVLTITANEELYNTGSTGDTIKVYAKVTQTNFARYKKTVKLTIEASPFILYNKDGSKVTNDSKEYSSKTPTISYNAYTTDKSKVHQDTLALNIPTPTPSSNEVTVNLVYNTLGFPVLKDTYLFNLGITYEVNSIAEGTSENAVNMMPIGEDDSYYQSTVTLTYQIE